MVVAIYQIRGNVIGGLEGRARVDAKHLLGAVSDDGGLVLSVSRLTQIMLQGCTAQVLIGGLQLMGILCQTQVACFGVLHLLCIEVCLHLIGIVIKILIDLMLTSCIVLAHSHLVALVSNILLVLKRWVDPDLIVQD
jgi:hypothetical protein